MLYFISNVQNSSTQHASYIIIDTNYCANGPEEVILTVLGNHFYKTTAQSLALGELQLPLALKAENPVNRDHTFSVFESSWLCNCIVLAFVCAELRAREASSFCDF